MSDDLEIFELPDGSVRATGLNAPTPDEVNLLESVGDYPEDWYLDESDIQRLLSHDYYKQSRRKWSSRMINQWKLGKCNASAAQAAMEQIRDGQGFDAEVLCDNQLYWRINRGRDAGSALVSAFNELRTNGISRRVVTVAGREYVIPVDVYNERQLPAGVAQAAAKDALRFVGWELYKVPADWDNFVKTVASALARRQPVVFAWHVGQNSSRLRNGYAVPGIGPGNHANVFHSGKYVAGREMVHPDNRNSWGPSKDPLYGPKGSGWGEDGYGLFTMEDAFACRRYHDYYVVTSAKPDPQKPAF